MTLSTTRDGKAPAVMVSNGQPLGPRVKRPGWRGWWLYAPDGSLVPDGHVEPVDPNERRGRRSALPACGKPGHVAEDRHVAEDGRVVCSACQRWAQARSVQARRLRATADRIARKAMRAA